MAGVGVRTVQELMGHKSIMTTIRYAHLAPGYQVKAVERLVGSTSTAAESPAENSETMLVLEGGSRTPMPARGARF